MDLSPEVILALMAVAMLAGMVDAIAGGGGLLTVPALLLATGDPVAAVATNKLQGTFGTASATWSFARHGHIDFRGAAPLATGALLGGIAGALAVEGIPVDLLRVALPFLLIGVAVYFALSPRLRPEDGPRRMSPLAFAALVGGGVGFYDGLFGPGAGSFYMLGLVTLMGLGAVRATGYTKLMNLASNLAALVVFVAGGKVLWAVGLTMAIGTVAGAQVGALVAMRIGARVIRPLLVVVCVLMAIRLAAAPDSPFRRVTLSDAIGLLTERTSAIISPLPPNWPYCRVGATFSAAGHTATVMVI